MLTWGNAPYGRAWTQIIGSVHGDPEIDQLYADLTAVSASSDEAKELWHQANEKVSGDALSVFIVYTSVLAAYNPERLGGFELGAGQILFPDIRELYVKG